MKCRPTGTRFNDTIRTSDVFANNWRTAVSDGMYPYRALLDTARFPEGARLCYPLGTDVRSPVDGSTDPETVPSGEGQPAPAPH